MKIFGTVKELGQLFEGQTTNGGFWSKKDLVLDVANGDKTVTVAITFFGDNRVRMIDALKIGTMVDVNCTIESREFDGKWYTQLNGYGFKEYQPVTRQITPEQPTPTEVNMPPVEMPPTDDPGF